MPLTDQTTIIAPCVRTYFWVTILYMIHSQKRFCYNISDPERDPNLKKKKSHPNLKKIGGNQFWPIRWKIRISDFQVSDPKCSNPIRFWKDIWSTDGNWYIYSINVQKYCPFLEVYLLQRNGQDSQDMLYV